MNFSLSTVSSVKTTLTDRSNKRSNNDDSRRRELEIPTLQANLDGERVRRVARVLRFDGDANKFGLCIVDKPFVDASTYYSVKYSSVFWNLLPSCGDDWVVGKQLTAGRFYVSCADYPTKYVDVRRGADGLLHSVSGVQHKVMHFKITIDVKCGDCVYRRSVDINYNHVNRVGNNAQVALLWKFRIVGIHVCIDIPSEADIGTYMQYLNNCVLASNYNSLERVYKCWLNDCLSVSLYYDVPELNNSGLNCVKYWVKRYCTFDFSCLHVPDTNTPSNIVAIERHLRRQSVNTESMVFDSNTRLGYTASNTCVISKQCLAVLKHDFAGTDADLGGVHFYGTMMHRIRSVKYVDTCTVPEFYRHNTCVYYINELRRLRQVARLAVSARGVVGK
jgi:hypothetical protein